MGRSWFDALYSDRVKLLRENPEEYVRKYPKPKWGWRKRPTKPDRHT